MEHGTKLPRLRFITSSTSAQYFSVEYLHQLPERASLPFLSQQHKASPDYQTASLAVSPSYATMPDPAVQINAKQKPMYIKVVDEAPHYTSGDRVRGVLRVDPTLRPQRIRLALKGFSILSDLTSNLATPTLFSHEQSMFESSGAHGNFDIMKKGTAADGKVELPFEFVFPYTVESTPPLDRDWQNVADSREQPRFQHSPGFSLPPSCSREVTIIERAAPVIMNRRPGTVIKSTPKVVLSRNVYALEACSESATPDTPPLQIRQEVSMMRMSFM